MPHDTPGLRRRPEESAAEAGGRRAAKVALEAGAAQTQRIDIETANRMAQVHA
jgi:hypothetical protein